MFEPCVVVYHDYFVRDLWFRVLTIVGIAGSTVFGPSLLLLCLVLTVKHMDLGLCMVLLCLVSNDWTLWHPKVNYSCFSFIGGKFLVCSWGVFRRCYFSMLRLQNSEHRFLHNTRLQLEKQNMKGIVPTLWSTNIWDCTSWKVVWLVNYHCGKW